MSPLFTLINIPFEQFIRMKMSFAFKNKKLKNKISKKENYLKKNAKNQIIINIYIIYTTFFPKKNS